MTREKTEIGALWTALDPTYNPTDDEIPDVDPWFADASYGMGVEPGSGSFDYWPVEEGVIVALACRVDGVRIEARSMGATGEEAERNVLDELRLAIERHRAGLSPLPSTTRKLN